METGKNIPDWAWKIAKLAPIIVVEMDKESYPQKKFVAFAPGPNAHSQGDTKEEAIEECHTRLAFKIARDIKYMARHDQNVVDATYIPPSIPR